MPVPKYQRMAFPQRAFPVCATLVAPWSARGARRLRKLARRAYRELVECQAAFAVLMSRFRRGLLVLRLRQWMYRRMRRLSTTPFLALGQALGQSGPQYGIFVCVWGVVGLHCS